MHQRLHQRWWLLHVVTMQVGGWGSLGFVRSEDFGRGGRSWCWRWGERRHTAGGGGRFGCGEGAFAEVWPQDVGDGEGERDG